MTKIKIILWLCLLIITKISVAQINHPNGGLAIDTAVYNKIPLTSSAGMGLLPSTKDLSDWFPSPGDQGPTQGSCVAFAACYALKSYHEAVERKIKPTNNTNIYSPSYVYNQIKLGSCGGGSSLYNTLELLKNQGVCSLNDFPYDAYNCNILPDATKKNLASKFKIATFGTVNFREDGDVKTLICSGFPVVFLMRIDDGFHNLGFNSIYNGSIGNQLGNHGMVVVGYDDTRSAYKVINSWGTLWGTNGYCWISYAAFRNRVIEAYSVQDIKDNNTVINTNPPNDTPISTPIPANVSISLNQPIINHNQMQNSPMGFVMGMVITVPGTILNSKGANGQLIVRFYNPNGTPLFANTAEFVYRDNQGLCAAGSLVLPITNNSAHTGVISLFIPYYALNFQNSGGINIHQVGAIASFYINNFEKAKSQLTTMTIRY